MNKESIEKLVEDAYLRGYRQGYNTAMDSALDVIKDCAKDVVDMRIESAAYVQKVPWYVLNDILKNASEEEEKEKTR